METKRFVYKQIMTMRGKSNTPRVQDEVEWRFGGDQQQIDAFCAYVEGFYMDHLFLISPEFLEWFELDLEHYEFIVSLIVI